LTELAAAGKIDLYQFKDKVHTHLSKMLTALEEVDCTPDDVFDPVIGDFMRELEQLTEFLYALGYNDRKIEEQEQRREYRVEAKQRAPGLEHQLQWVDRQVQAVAEQVGLDEKVSRYVAPMKVDMLLMAVVKLLDFLPASVFAEDRMIPPTFPSFRDATVKAMVDALTQRYYGSQIR
jgi:hypothetical protein